MNFQVALGRVDEALEQHARTDQPFERGRTLLVRGTIERRAKRRAEARRQYLGHVADLLDAAAHIPAWAVAYTDDGFLPTEELVETIRRLRRVGTIYTKDFTELAGARAVIITA